MIFYSITYLVLEHKDISVLLNTTYEPHNFNNYIIFSYMDITSSWHLSNDWTPDGSTSIILNSILGGLYWYGRFLICQGLFQ